MVSQGTKSIYRNKSNAFEIVSMVVLICIFCLVVVFDSVFYDEANEYYLTNVIISLLSLIFIIILFGFCVGGFTWDEKEKRFFEWLILIFYLITILQEVNALLPYSVKTLKLHFILDNSFYVLASVYWVCLWIFQKDKHNLPFDKKYVEWFIITFFSLFSLLAIINMITEFDFAYAENGEVIIKHHFLTTFSIVWYVIYAVFISIGKSDVKTKLTLLSYSIFPLLSYVLIMMFYESSAYLSLSINLNVIFYLIPLYLIFFNVYMERGKTLLMNERELEKSRANVMALQINPHFIANTMASIVALCGSKAPEARNLASKFAKYLRDNYVNMTEDILISFEKELEHVKNYCEVEKVRFPQIEIKYDIQSKDFLLPTLTVQTLVENAIRHGLQKKEDPEGFVEISSKETDLDYVITIRDNGVGFDAEKATFNEKQIGIRNVKFRLEVLCGGRLEIESEIGKGAKNVIYIPKSKNGVKSF